MANIDVDEKTSLSSSLEETTIQNEVMTQNSNSVNDNEMYEQDFEPLVENAKTFMKGGCNLFKSVANFVIKKEDDQGFSEYLTEKVKEIYKVKGKEFRGKSMFKCLLTLVCFKAGLPIFENRFSQLRMTYHHAYEKYKELPEEQREEVSSVQKLADDYRKDTPSKSRSPHNEDSSFEKRFKAFIQRHKKDVSDQAYEIDGVRYEIKVTTLQGNNEQN